MVVDFTDLGGDVVVRCVVGPLPDGMTGLAALRAAGFTVTGTARWGDAFVCRIQGRPAASESLSFTGNSDYHEVCGNTPPPQAYWGYWHAADGGTWQSSSLGASSRQVVEGGFEGWAFSLDHTTGANPAPRYPPSRPGPASPPPTTAPTTAPAPAPTTTPTTAPTTAPTTTPTTTPTTAPTTTPPTTKAPTTRPSRVPTAKAPTAKAPTAKAPGTETPTTTTPPGGKHPPAPSPSSGPAPGGSSGGGGSGPAHPHAAGRGHHKAPGAGATSPRAGAPGETPGAVTGELPSVAGAAQTGSATNTLIGVGLVALLGAAGAAVAWRRRRAGQ
ncbi:MAG: LPXTG cell wall anchor domain-containing protein [Nocardioidaceae bacterium]